ncbi:MAG: TetR family transcriptional regulator [Alphaproteobacteria bacterium HGW-Alphaproteobacteria-18]|nr:MAG: TetR family transcriptional regulator [Alphaproteobacteria bacterium HGW-Alphaproteobacteria-18]
MPAGKKTLAKPAVTSARIPQQARSGESRANILNAARKAFAEKGFEAANIRDIATDAGVTHTLIRYHFGSKEELWKEVVTHMFQRLGEEMREGLKGVKGASPQENLREFLRTYIRYCARNPEHVRIMIMESVHGGDRIEWMISYIRKSHQNQTPFLRRLMKDGDIPEVWLVSLFYSISAICQMPFVLAQSIKGVYGVDILSDEAIEAHTDTVLALLLRDKPKSRKHWPALPAWTSASKS